LIGKTLNHYEVLSRIGKGGMGEVYLARDTKLDRQVALKVLPEELAASPDRRARFEREAKAIAALKHPNIVTIYSVEKSNGVDFITMELIEGKRFSELIPKNGFPLQEFLDRAVSLSDALGSAHKQGITHRDIKPDNIMLDAEGRLKVLDFGLAKVRDETGQPGLGTQELTAAATPSTPGTVTQEGKILGTVAYMSPEQAEGKPIDSRTDIFSLGVVLYEMATGQRPFKGDTHISMITSIMRDEPVTVTALNQSLPRHLGRIVRRCLAKKPDRRYQTAIDLRNELEELKAELESGELQVPAGIAPARPGSARKWTAVAVAAVVLIGAAFVLQNLLRNGGPPPAGPASIRPLTSMDGVEHGASWSPDGTFLAFGHFPGPGPLFVVPTAGGDAVPLVESEAGDVSPRWSPDSRWIGYVSNHEGRNGIFLVPPLGGRVRRLADTNIPVLDVELQIRALGRNPWSPDGGRLLFSRRAPDGSAAIWEIELDSRREAQLTRPEPGVTDLGASWSFDGRRIVFTRDAYVWLLVPGGDPQPLLGDEPVEGWQPTWMPDGDRIVFVSNRSGNDDLWEIDTVSGSLRQITSGPGSEGSPAVARDGRIAFATWSHQQDLYVVSLEEQTHERLTSHTGWNQDARISPDGGRIAYESDRTGDFEIWVIDRATSSEMRLTSDPAPDTGPEWSPDGKQVAFASDRDGEPGFWVINADGSGGRRRLTRQAVPGGSGNLRWSPDGAAIGFLGSSEQGPALYQVDLTTGEVTPRIYGVETFDWYLDGERVIYTPITRDSDGRMEMRVANLRTGNEDVLLEEPHTELTVSRDGAAVAYCRAANHWAMQLYYLKLRSPSPASADGLPTPEGKPVQLTGGDGKYHVHNGGWSPDGKQIVYTRDTDAGDIYVIEPPPGNSR
jgi:Tol biopolymer transport system component/predicted Ser/Thr protein kinase